MDEHSSIAAEDAELADLPLALLMQIDQLADDFESACRIGREPSVDSFVRQLPEANDRVRDVVSRHLLQIRAELEAAPVGAERTIHRGGSTATPPVGHAAAHPPLAITLDQRVAIGDYRLLELLGSGGMGVVYKAVHTRLDRFVAIKFPKFAAGLDRAGAARFVREAKLVGRLTHPHIVRALDAGESPYGPYLVTEFIDGETLEARVRRDGPLPFKTAVNFAAQAAAALSHAHANNVIHRDVKPSNMLIDRDETLRVVDFGLAKSVVDDLPSASQPASEQTAHGAFLGTVGYAAPEQLRANQTVDHRADVYALGCVLYFMLTGEPPHAGTLADRLLAERRSRASSMRLGRDDIPPTFAKTWQRMVAFAPQHRIASMTEVERGLEQALNAEPPRHSRVNASRRAAIAAFACTIAIGLAAWASGAFQDGDSDSSTPKLAPAGPPPPRAIAPFSANKAKASKTAWAKHLGLPLRILNKAEIPLVLLPPGEFTMGLAETPLNTPPLPTTDWRFREPEIDRNLQLPRHRVVLTRPIYFGETEITNAQFRRFVDATGYVTDAERDRGWGKEDRGWLKRPGYSWKNLGTRLVADDYPVINVTWNDAMALGDWLTSIDERGKYRPPTEAEWEYACRAGADAHYSFGNDPDELTDHGWFADNSEGLFRAVAQKRPNPFGLYDLHGNRQEWCLDNYDPDFYKSAPQEDPICQTGDSELRVMRGGVHTDAASFCTASQRWAQPPNDPGASGIRIVCEPSPSP